MNAGLFSKEALCVNQAFGAVSCAEPFLVGSKQKLLCSEGIICVLYADKEDDTHSNVHTLSHTQAHVVNRIGQS